MTLDERLKEARRLIQAQHDALVEHWGNDPSTLDPDFDYAPGLNLLRDTYRWLAVDDPPAYLAGPQPYVSPEMTHEYLRRPVDASKRPRSI